MSVKQVSINPAVVAHLTVSTWRGNKYHGDINSLKIKDTNNIYCILMLIKGKPKHNHVFLLSGNKRSNRQGTAIPAASAVEKCEISW